jgi:hypothetical protein
MSIWISILIPYLRTSWIRNARLLTDKFSCLPEEICFSFIFTLSVTNSAVVKYTEKHFTWCGHGSLWYAPVEEIYERNVINTEVATTSAGCLK